ncbi:hypothetical protein BDV12DRAFT_173969 [Aspergillus spectabilis]
MNGHVSWMVERIHSTPDLCGTAVAVLFSASNTFVSLFIGRQILLLSRMKEEPYLSRPWDAMN